VSLWTSLAENQSYKESLNWNPIYTSEDPECAWQYAKMWCQFAEMSVFQTRSHLVATHLVMEPFVISMKRNLSPCHPIYRLLTPHFDYLLAINSLGRKSLISTDGIIIKTGSFNFNGFMTLMERSYQDWNFPSSSFPGLLSRRKFDVELPGYFYQQDGLKLWNAIFNFVNSILQNYYKSNDDIKNDNELEVFIREISVIGYASHQVHGLFPESVNSIDELAEILATVIFTESVQHAVLNYKQFDSFAFVPFSPGSIFKKPLGFDKELVDKNTITEDHIFSSLPPREVAIQQVSIMYVLSSYSGEDSRIGAYEKVYFTDSDSLLAITNFRNELASIENEIRIRGVWLNLLPSNIPCSTAV